MSAKYVVAGFRPAFGHAGLLHGGRPERGLEARDYILELIAATIPNFDKTSFSGSVPSMIDWTIPWWGWFTFGFLLLLLELASPGGFYFFFFGVGAICVGVLAWLSILTETWVELTVFSIVSVIASLLFRKPLLARFGPKSVDTVVDSLVGEACTVMDNNIEIGGIGKVELRGTAWNARNGSNRALTRGDRCKVERVDGLSLLVTREES